MSSGSDSGTISLSFIRRRRRLEEHGANAVLVSGAGHTRRDRKVNKTRRPGLSRLLRASASTRQHSSSHDMRSLTPPRPEQQRFQNPSRLSYLGYCTMRPVPEIHFRPLRTRRLSSPHIVQVRRGRAAAMHTQSDTPRGARPRCKHLKPDPPPSRHEPSTDSAGNISRRRPRPPSPRLSARSRHAPSPGVHSTSPDDLRTRDELHSV